MKRGPATLRGGQANFGRAKKGHIVRHGRVALVIEELTPRHREVLQLIAEGQTNREIAVKLDVSGGRCACSKTLAVRNRLAPAGNTTSTRLCPA